MYVKNIAFQHLFIKLILNWVLNIGRRHIFELNFFIIFILSYLILSYLILSYLILLILSYFILFYFMLFYLFIIIIFFNFLIFVLFCFVLFCFVLFCFVFVFPFLLPCYLRLVGGEKLQRQPPAPFSFSAIQSRYTCIMTVNSFLFWNHAPEGCDWPIKMQQMPDPKQNFWKKDRRSKKWARPSENNLKTDITELPKVVSPSMNIKWENTRHFELKFLLFSVLLLGVI